MTGAKQSKGRGKGKGNDHASPSSAVKLLTRQHREVEVLFARYRRADDPNEKLDIFTEISDALEAHGAIEEKIFYPAVYTGKLADKLHEAVEEHLAMKRLIADLLPLSPSQDAQEYDAKVTVLSEQVDHHVKEEEEALFPAVTKTFSVEKLDQLGEQMERMFNSLIEESPGQEAAGQTQVAAPLPDEDGQGASTQQR